MAGVVSGSEVKDAMMSYRKRMTLGSGRSSMEMTQTLTVVVIRDNGSSKRAY